MAPSLGVELEMPVVRLDDGTSHGVGNYFRALHGLKARRGEAAALAFLKGREVAVEAPLVHSGLDNAFNNLESAIGPVVEPDLARALERLDALMRQEFDDVAVALATEGAALVNVSQHPAAPVDAATYRRLRAPRPIYDEWVGWRRWDHAAGIDAKAHNGPTTGVAAGDAVMALNVVLAAAPALIALFANSPFEAGRPSGLKETRLTLWPRMFARPRHAGDARLHRLPDAPFRDLRDYFTWMHGPGTAMHVLPLPLPGDGAYKGAGAAARLAGEPPLLDFLRGPPRPARRLPDGGTVTVTPHLRHLEWSQFAHFLDARIRFAFAAPLPELENFHAAWRRDGGLEALFEESLAHCYIEGRAPGTNLPDAELLAEAGLAVTASVLTSPSAIQAGLLSNLDGAGRWLKGLDWRALAALREAAMRDGLAGRAAGIAVADLCRQVLQLAAEGLPARCRWMLAYPEWVLGTGRTGADRALAAFAAMPGSPEERLRRLCLRRLALAPSQWPAQAAV